MIRTSKRLFPTQMSSKPLIAICGTTGVGKSKLAIELALALSSASESTYGGARVINADAMQVYSGIDILTNKVPVEERCGVPHLLMGFKKPGEQYVVGDWVRDAIKLIDETHARNQVPIVVGGTAYWIQHLIFPGKLATFDPPHSLLPSPTTPSPSSTLSPGLEAAISTLPPHLLSLYNDLPTHPPSAATDPDAAFALHTLLSALDSPVAQRWHWKDTRKVLRSLGVIREMGKLSSEIIEEQSGVKVPPRYRTLCFWLYAKPEALNPRLDERVDQMLEQGLLQEVDELMKAVSSQEPSSGDSLGQGTDYTLGLYQSIGYKEFSTYLSTDPSLPPTKDDTLYNAAVERMKLSTRKYAKRQVGWIRNKLLPEVYTANAESEEEVGMKAVPMYLLDATELGDKWQCSVQDSAVQITKDFLELKQMREAASLSDTAREMLSVRNKPTRPDAVLSARRKVICSTCTLDETQPVMIEEGREWAAHVQTKVHRKLARRAKDDASGDANGHHGRRPRVDISHSEE